MSAERSETIMTVDEFAARMRVSRRMVQRWIAQNADFPSVKMGWQRRILADQATEWCLRLPAVVKAGEKVTEKPVCDPQVTRGG